MNFLRMITAFTNVFYACNDQRLVDRFNQRIIVDLYLLVFTCSCLVFRSTCDFVTSWNGIMSTQCWGDKSSETAINFSAFPCRELFEMFN